MMGLRIDREVRRIEEKLRASPNRSSIQLITRLAVRVDDLRQALLEVQPEVVHFSGHGTDEHEILLEEDSGAAHPVSKEALAGLFGVLKDRIRVVVLNACYSRAQAEALAEHIDFTIGMREELPDDAAIELAATFYEAIGFGRSVQTAFDIGVNSLKLKGIPGADVPELIVRKGVNPSEVSLVQDARQEAGVHRAAPRKAETEEAVDEVAEELSRIARAALLAASNDDLARSLYEVEALLARSPHNIEARLLRDRFKRAIARALHTRKYHGTSLNPLTRADAPVAVQPRPRAPLSGFTGRQRELLELQGQAGPAGVLICGPGGMGKTALAIALVQALAPQHPDFQIDIDLEGSSREPLSPEAAMTRVVRAFLPELPPHQIAELSLRGPAARPMPKLPDRPEELAALYQGVLRGQRALVLLKDARDRAQIEPLLPPAGSMLIATSRRRFDLPGIHVLSLDRLSGPDAQTLLQSLAPTMSHAAANDLAELCGGVPLALRLAGCALTKRPDLAPDAYIDRVKLALSRDERIDAFLSVSLDLLDPILQIVWSRLGLFTSRFDHSVIWDLSRSGLVSREDLSELVAYGLLDHDLGTNLYSLPRSSRRLAMSRMTEADRAAAERALARQKSSQENIDRFVRHAGAGPMDLEGPLRAAQRAGYGPAEALYMERMVHRLGAAPAAAALAEQALAIYRACGDRWGESRVLDKLVHLYESMKDEDRAVEHGEQALCLLRELGDRRKESAMLRMLETMGRLYENRKDDRRAVELYEQCLSVRPQASVAWQMSAAYERLGELDKAIAALELCADLRRGVGRESDAESKAAELKRLRASRGA
jgi:tetratricopeptide (TPR) repeat protein